MTTIIENFQPSGGKHCITNSLKQIFNYYKYPISEEMLFGIGSGLGFAYLNLVNSPVITGRTKILDFERKIAERLNIKIKLKSTKQQKIAFEKCKLLISKGQPVLVYVDMPYLKYLNLDENNHFGGHAIVIIGFDDTKNEFYVSDRDNSDSPIRTPKGYIAEDFHLVSYQQMEKARSSNHRPFPANNKWLEFDFSAYQSITDKIVVDAVTETCRSMIMPPANLLGVNGIKKLSNEVLKWGKFENSKLKLAGITNYFMINADGGTGGGAFRNIYGRFLLEANEKFKINGFQHAGEQYIKISEQWEKIAEKLWLLSETGEVDILKEISLIAKEIFDAERTVLSSLYNNLV